ncbi:uncharacterized protein EAE98_004455 [Botrytis deweyae]|uniref:Fungal N-terminal domain-containing protein n=1 Tax=Botrytis deweyae TaxID=2478750 RepID=A0ABQ7IR65_9HELO|nr:uncharacterized protein EAE98_004455 [Botrytis deweyae]KAF7931719.1 hypothetical protein EAE98_004455 [Botrytis deweyae]
MAEIGIIASGMGVASLGLQLMDGVRKLKQFWDEVKEAPEDIQYALEELDALSLVLSDIHTSNSNLPSIPSATVTRCSELCRRGTDILNTIVKDLNVAISKRRKIGSAKVVLKKDTLDKFRNRLRDAQYMLMLSRQTYSDALQTEYHKLQIEAVESHANRQLQGIEELKLSVTRSANVMSSTLLQSRDTVVYDYETKRPMRGRTRTKLDRKAKCFQKKFRTPRLFSSSGYTWDFSGYQAPSGWTFNFRQYYTINGDSLTWRCVFDGDVSGLQVLFQSKRATPFDRVLHGMTLLDLASSREQYDICRLLLDQGADPNDSSKTSALSYNVRRSCISASGNSVLKLLYPISEIHNPLQDISTFHVDLDTLSLLLHKIDPTFKEWSFEERMMFALKVCNFTIYCSTAGMISLMLHEDQLNEVCCKMVFGNRPEYISRTFLSIELDYVASVIFSWFRRNRDSTICSDSTQLIARKAEFGPRGRFSNAECFTSIELIERLIANGSEIFRGGLLPCLLSGNTWTSPHVLPYSGICPVSVQLWLEILHDSGTDLLKYGKVEHDHFMDRDSEDYSHSICDTTSRWRLFFERKRKMRNGKSHYILDRGHLISFVYGPAIEDWKFWYSWDEPRRNYYQNFRDFWELVDHPERGMPGAWEDYELNFT